MAIFVYTIIFSAALIQCFFLITVFLKEKKDIKPNLFLVGFISIISLQIFVKLAGFYSSILNIESIFSIFYFIPYLYGPLVFLYVRKYYDREFRIKPITVLHFFPFLISGLIILICELHIFDLFEYIDNDIYNISDTFVQLVILNCYVFAVKKIINSNKIISDRWFRNFTNSVWLTGTVLIIFFTLFFYDVKIWGISSTAYSFVILILPAMILWLTYINLINNSGFKQYQLIHENIDPEPNTKLSNNHLNEIEINNILLRLNEQIEQNKIFLEPDLSLESLAVKMDIPRHRISRTINQSLKLNFNEYVNLKRVEFAKRELINPANSYLTIAAIAYNSGFNSISTFNEAFKKHTGMTPSQYKKQIFKDF